MKIIHREIHVQNGTRRVAHPFQDVFVGQILLSTIAGKEMSERVQLVLLGILKSTLSAQVLEIVPEFLRGDLSVFGHEENQV